MHEVSNELLIEQTEVKPITSIGKGSYGEVWSGTWSSTQVAIKKLSLAEAFTPEAIHVLRREVEVIAKLRHPNIIQIYGVCVISTTDMWLVMELADGGSLYSLLASDTFISWCDRWRIAKEVVLAVAYLHSRGVQHRDLKSPNFLVVKGGIKLCDFGMAGNIHNSSASRKASIIANGRPLGSARWIAPEATPSEDEVPIFSDKSDVYSLGIVLWEIASRLIPFHNVSFDYQVLGMVKYGNQRPPIPTSCPETFAAVIKKCWSPLASDRPRASEVLTMFENEVAAQDPENIVDRKSLYFEVSKQRLFECVPQEHVRVLAQPPPLPPQCPSIEVPSTIEIVRLHPPKTTKKAQHHMLLSETYDAVLWRRISEYFTRFYGTQNTARVELTAIDVIFNAALEARFAAENSLYESKFAGLQEFKISGSNQQGHFLEHLSKSANLLANNNANPISAWHGTSSSKLDSICWYGLLNLSVTDPGYIGKGIYLTQEPKYGEYYAEYVKVKEGGNFSLLLCWALLGRPFAVDKVKLGCSLQPNHTSHYTLVRRKRITRSVCELDEDFVALESVTTFLPIEIGEEAQGDEIVLFNSAQILPRYIVHYSVIPPAEHKTIKNSKPLPIIPPNHTFSAPASPRSPIPSSVPANHTPAFLPNAEQIDQPTSNAPIPISSTSPNSSSTYLGIADSIQLSTTIAPLYPVLTDTVVSNLWYKTFFAEHLDRWCSDFALIYVQNPYHISLVGRIHPQVLVKYDLLVICFLYASNFRDTKHIPHKILLDTFSTINELAGIEEYWGLLANLPSENAKPDEPKESLAESFSSFTQEVATYFIPDREAIIAQCSNTQYDILITNLVAYVNKFSSPLLKDECEIQAYWKFFAVFRSSTAKQKELLIQKATLKNLEASTIFYYPLLTYSWYKRNTNKNNLLEDVVFFALLHENNDKIDLAEACNIYKSKTDYLSQAVAATVVLKQLALLIPQEEFIAKVAGNGDVIKHILLAGNQYPPLEDKIPINLAGLYLLHLPKAELHHVLVPAKLKLLELEAWSIKNCMDNYPLFPFMLDNHCEILGQPYVALYNMLQEDETAILPKIKAAVSAGPHIRYQYRMLIPLLCYYHYYNHLYKCRTVLKLLQQAEFLQLLNITPNEQIIFKMLASEPPRNIERDNNGLLYLFSYEVREQPEVYAQELVVANIMVNTIVVALGSPEDTNHIYSYAFNFADSGASSPGSTLPRKAKLGTSLDNYPKLSKYYTYKLAAINTLVWAAIAWNRIIVRELLNASFLTRFRFSDKLSQEPTIQARTVERLMESFVALQEHPEFKAKEINGLFFLTESLWEMWQDILHNGRDKRWKGIFANENDATVYENSLISIFERVLANYPTRRAKNRIAHNDNKHVRNIMELKERQKRRFHSPLVPFELFIEYINQDLPDNLDQHIHNSRNIYFLRNFVGRLDKINALKYIPTLVEYYIHLTTSFATQIEYAKIYEIEFPASVLYEPTEKVKWNQFIKAWEEILCHYELNDPLIPKSIKYIDLVDKSRDHRGVIVKLLQRLVACQYQVLNDHNGVQHPRPEKVELASLSERNAQDVIVMGAYSITDFELLVMSHMKLDEIFTKKSLQFNVKRIADVVWKKMIQGKAEFSITSFYKDVQFKGSTQE